MTDALIKELRDEVRKSFQSDESDPWWESYCNSDSRWRAADMLEALSGPGDAEQEELAKWCEHSAESELANPLNSNYVKTRLSQQYFRIAQLLRRPVAPVVTDEMVEPANKAYRENEQHGRAFAMKRALEAALNVSQPGVK